MNIYVNDRQKSVKENIKIQELLTELDISRSKGIAIAVNQEVIDRNGWPDHSLKENDKVMIIKAAQGG